MSTQEKTWYEVVTSVFGNKYHQVIWKFRFENDILF